jgi:DNA-binding PadR family transcriptional regulator
MSESYSENERDPRGGAHRGRRLVLPAVLLALAEGESYGYAIAARLAEQGFLTGGDTATVYRILARLETDGLAVATLRDSDVGPRRKTYTITDAGRRELDAWADLMATRLQTLHGFLRRYRALD